MADHSQRLAIVVTASDLASGKLGKVRMELASMGMSGKLASVGLGGAMLAVNKGEQALGNLKNRLTSLAAPLAMVGLTGGVLSIGGALAAGIGKADEMGLAVEKVTGATNLGAHAASQMVAVFGKYGIGADQVATLMGRFEKNTFLAGKTVKDATKFQKEYGFSVLDSKGHIKDASTLLGTLSDAYLKNHNVAQRDALMAKLLGKTWVDMIPVLKLGSKAIIEAGVEADKMGLTLKSAQDVQNVHDFIAAQRDAKDAVAGVEMQLGLLVMPDLAAGLRTSTGYVATHGDDLKRMFTDGLHTAEAFGGFLTGTVVPAIQSIAGAAAGIWAKLDPGMKDLLVKGFVADRTLKFFFGMSPIHAIVSLAAGGLAKGLGSIVGAIFTRGSLANPMFVKDIGIKLPGPGSGIPDVVPAAGGGLLTTIAAAAAGLVAILGAPLVATYFAQNHMFGFQPGAMPTRFGPAGTGGRGPAISGGLSLDDRQMAADARAAAATQKVSDHMDALTGSLDDLRKGTHALLNEQIKHQGAAFLAAGDAAGTAARDTAVTKDVQLFQTSDSPSLVSMSANLRLMLREAKVHPTDKVVAAAIVTLQALVAATTAAVNALPHTVAGGTGGMVGQDQYTPLAVHVNVAPAPLHKAVIKYGRGSNVGSGVRGY